ncbi:MAG: hypothetical protein ABJA67_16910 [Chthonomonadales bacterium]
MLAILEHGEVVLKDGRASHVGFETHAGMLFLTNRRMIFIRDGDVIVPLGGSAHPGGIMEIQLKDIESCEPAYTTLLGIIPLVPDRIDITCYKADRFSFNLNDREEWLAAIVKAAHDEANPTSN